MITPEELAQAKELCGGRGVDLGDILTFFYEFTPRLIEAYEEQQQQIEWWKITAKSATDRYEGFVKGIRLATTDPG